MPIPSPTGDDASANVDDGGSGPDLHAVPDGITPGEIGWPCSAAQECANGLCIDGYCCENACDRNANLCKACNVPGQEGHCALVLDGTDPRQQCDQDPASSCGRDGLCDGNGQCRLYGAGTVCGLPSCANGIQTYAAACDGAGHCQPPGPPASCYPYVCADASLCATSCSSAAQCATGIVCDSSGSCGKRANGQPCTNDNQCQSIHCAQGVCCASACSGTCFACNLPGTQGSCAAVPNGMDPLNQCTAANRNTCGLDGQCNGSGACRLWAAGTQCGNAGCQGDAMMSAPRCDGLGACKSGTLTPCGNYSCNPASGACYTSCNGAAQCATSKICNGGGKCK